MISEENSSKGYRSRLEIIRDILSVVEDAGRPGSKKTHIMYGANLSYKLLKRYVDDALRAGLICHDKRSSYVITDKGKEFLRAYEAYEKERKEFEKHIICLSNGKEELRRMLEC